MHYFIHETYFRCWYGQCRGGFNLYKIKNPKNFEIFSVTNPD